MQNLVELLKNLKFSEVATLRKIRAFPSIRVAISLAKPCIFKHPAIPNARYFIRTFVIRLFWNCNVVQHSFRFGTLQRQRDRSERSIRLFWKSARWLPPYSEVRWSQAVVFHDTLQVRKSVAFHDGFTVGFYSKMSITLGCR